MMVGIRRKHRSPEALQFERGWTLPSFQQRMDNGSPSNMAGAIGNRFTQAPIYYSKAFWNERHAHRRSSRSWLCWIFCLFGACGGLVGVAFVIFVTARVLLMDRPAIIYGTPVQNPQLLDCIRKDFSNLRLETAVSIPTKARADWWPFSNVTFDSTALERNFHVHTVAQTAEKITANPSRRLLIAQYSGTGSYMEMLKLVAPINAAYAHHWGHDFLLVQGTAMDFPSIDRTKCPNDEYQSTFNKIPILEWAYTRGRDESGIASYDEVLILDTDAMIVDFSVDISTLLPVSHMMAAHRVYWFDGRNTWDVNAGVTLWNLEHPAVPSLTQRWKDQSIQHPELVLQRNDDQYFLQRALWERSASPFATDETQIRSVWSLRHEFEYYEGTVIRHFKRDARSWDRTSLEQRMLRIQEVIRNECPKMQLITGSLDCRYNLGNPWDNNSTAN